MPDTDTLRRVRARLHDSCLLCGDRNAVGFKLDFSVLPDGSVTADFMCKFMFEGYKGFLHGGVMASLLDCAMTNCLFAYKVAAFTAEFNIKYRRPVRCGRKVTITARLIKACAPLYYMESALIQDGQIAVTATAKFMESELLASR